MIVIRRAVDKDKSYTVIFLKGEPPKWIPTSDYEHARILSSKEEHRLDKAAVVVSGSTSTTILHPRIPLPYELW